MGISTSTKTPSDEPRDGARSPASARHSHLGVGAEHALADDTSPGVRLAQLTPLRMNTTDRVLVFCSMFVAAFAYSLDACMRPISFQPAAASDMGQHALVGSVNIVVAVCAAAFQPIIAKIADVFGRPQVVVVSIAAYGIGTLIQATARDIAAFAAGAAIYNLGYVAVVLLLEIVIADLTSMRSRVFFSYLPALPYLINTWLSGVVAAESLDHLGWQWSIGMWGIIYPVCALPLMISLWLYCHQAKKLGIAINDHPARIEFKELGWRRFLGVVFWELDIIGMLLLACALGLVLTPLALMRGVEAAPGWKEACIWVPLSFGIICWPIFILWERRALHPMMPYHLLRDRAVWGSMGIAFAFNMAWSVQSEYMFALLRVGYLQSTRAANQINNVYIFTSTLLGPLVGLWVYKCRYLRPFIFGGTLLFLAGFILLAVMNSGLNDTTNATGTEINPPVPFVIFGQILLGMGGSLFPFLTMASVQAAVRHEHLAAVTGLYFAMYRVGAAVGACVAATVMTQYGQSHIYRVLNRHDFIAGYAYESPLSFADEHFCPNSPNAELECAFLLMDRVATALAYQHIQYVLCVIAAAMCVPLIIFTFAIRNPRLGDDQTQYSLEVLRPHEPYEPERQLRAPSTHSHPTHSHQSSHSHQTHGNGSSERPRTPVLTALARSMTPHSRRSGSASQSRRASLLGPLGFTPSRKSVKSGHFEMDEFVVPVPSRFEKSEIWDGTQDLRTETVHTTVHAVPRRGDA